VTATWCSIAPAAPETTSQTARGTFTLLVSGAAGAIEHHVAVTPVVR